MKLNTKKSIVLVVDIQERLMTAMAVDRARQVEKSAAILVKGASVMDVPVMVTEQYPRGLGPTVAGVRSSCLQDQKVWEKTGFSCAKVHQLVDSMVLMGRTQIVLCGMESHVCVYQTARDLRAMGHEVVVAQDAVCSRTEDNRRIGLELMAGEGAVLSCTETILFDWLGEAVGPQFKAISTLIK